MGLDGLVDLDEDDGLRGQPAELLEVSSGGAVLPTGIRRNQIGTPRFDRITGRA
jgi:hypothetical protein